MKQSIRYILILLLCLPMVFSGCTDKDEHGKHKKDKLEILHGEENPLFKTAGGEKKIVFNAPGQWYMTTDQLWCDISPRTGEGGVNEVTIKAKENVTYDERNAVLKINCGGETIRMNVVQKQVGALTLSSSKIETDCKGGNIKIEVRSSVKYDCLIQSNAASWISQTPATRGMDTSCLEFRIAPNEAFNKREGTITISSPDLDESETITVYQSSNVVELVLTSNNYILGPEAQDIKVELTSNIDCKMSVSGRDWLTQKNTRSLSSHTYHFGIAANDGNAPREGNIRFTYKVNGIEYEEFVNIYQHSTANLPQLLFVHHRSREFQAPQLWGSGNFKARVLWGDGSAAAEYASGLSKTYQDKAATHTVTVAADDANRFHLDNICGIREINLSDF